MVKIHKDCPLTQEQIDEIENDLLNVATANGCPRVPVAVETLRRQGLEYVSEVTRIITN